MDIVARLCRRFPSLDPDDARQYLAEARCELGAEAADAALWRAVLARARADGYGDPVVIPADRDDGEGHVRDWLDAVGDSGAGAAAVYARLGRADAATRRGLSARPGRLRRAVLRLLASAPAAERTVLWARWGRLLNGLAPHTFRECAQASDVALGTAWNIEDRARRLIRDALRRPEPRALQLGFSWRADDRPAPPPAPPPEALASRESESQLRLPW